MPGTVSSLLFGLSRPFSLRDRLAEAEAIPFRQPGILSDGLRLLRRLPLLLHRKLVSQCFLGGDYYIVIIIIITPPRSGGPVTKGAR